MTRDYETERFHDSQFLVFTNRALAGVVALLGVLSLPQPAHRVPIYQYAYSSLSNILSSWFQYEALKFVSFPTQVLAKASKIIPVMLMGKIVNKRSFLPYEYASAGKCVLFSACVIARKTRMQKCIHKSTKGFALQIKVLERFFLAKPRTSSNERL